MKNQVEKKWRLTQISLWGLRAGGCCCCTQTQSLWPVYQSFTKCLRVNNRPDSSWQDTRWYPGPPFLSPQPAQTGQTQPNPAPSGTGLANPSDSSHPLPCPTPTCSKRQMARRGRGDICRLDNRRSVRTAGADRLGAPLLCAAPYTCRLGLQEEGPQRFLQGQQWADDRP